MTQSSFRRMKSLKKFAAVHGPIHNDVNQERALVSRQTFKDRRAHSRASSRCSLKIAAQGIFWDFFYFV